MTITHIRDAFPTHIRGAPRRVARIRQFVEARRFLDALPRPHLVVPGNHDIPLYDIGRRFLTPLGRYHRFIADDVEPVFVDGEMVVLGLNSARSLSFGRGRNPSRALVSTGKGGECVTPPEDGRYGVPANPVSGTSE